MVIEKKKRKVTGKAERSNVNFPLWRKKIDNSVFDDNSTPLPNWIAKSMELEKYFPKAGSLRKSSKNQVEITFQKQKYLGHVTTVKPNFRYKLSFADDLVDELKRVFLMSHMRSIETALRPADSKLEEEIPFWEFLDIEFEANKLTFHLTAHYTQKPIFPELFKNLAGSPSLKSIDDHISNKDEFRIHKQNWMTRDLLESQIGARNVIYTLLDSKNKLIYVGEAKDLISRLKQVYPTIPQWTHFRYDVLPQDTTTKVRVAIERMMIRSYASLLENKKDIESIFISNYKLANDKIDK